MDICLAFDNNYAPFAAVTIDSIVATGLSTGDSVTFWVLAAEDVEQSTLDLIRRRAGSRARLELLNADGALARLPVSAQPGLHYLSPAMYLRLVLPELLPAPVARVLYLDSDTLCVGELAGLFKEDLAGCALAAAPDAYNTTVGHGSGIPGQDPAAGPDVLSRPYFNSGVLLIDTARWRRLEITRRCLEYVQAHAGELRFPDQDALNLVLDDRWHRLSPIWNEMESYRLEEPGRSVSEARILHFAGPIKPWIEEFPGGEVRSRYRGYFARHGR